MNFQNVRPPRNGPIATLVRLLNAFQTHGQRYMFSRGGAVQSCQRTYTWGLLGTTFQYTNHKPVQTGHTNDLLHQVSVWFPMKDAPTLIELIDLPGLATVREADDLTSLAFIPELDGTLVFLSARQSREKSITKVLNALNGEKDPRWRFGSLEFPLTGRIWVVSTCVRPTVSRATWHLAGTAKTSSWTIWRRRR